MCFSCYNSIMLRSLGSLFTDFFERLQRLTKSSYFTVLMSWSLCSINKVPAGQSKSLPNSILKYLVRILFAVASNIIYHFFYEIWFSIKENWTPDSWVYSHSQHSFNSISRFCEIIYNCNFPIIIRKSKLLWSFGNLSVAIGEISSLKKKWKAT